MNMNITVPLLGLIGQFLLIVGIFFAFFIKVMNRISNLEGANKTLRTDFTNHVMYVKEEFQKIGGTDKEILGKLDAIKDGMHDVKLDIVEIKAELKYKNGNQNKT
jgi:hypothetical protein